MKNCTQKEDWYSETVTAVVVPPYIDSSEIVRRAWKRYNLSLGLGLNKIAGKVFRIGHLGNLNEVCSFPKFTLAHIAGYDYIIYIITCFPPHILSSFYSLLAIAEKV